MGVKDIEIFAVLHVKGIDDIGEDEIITLRGLLNSIKDGDTTVEQVFRPTAQSEGASSLNDALKGRPAAAPATPAAAQPTPTREPGEETVCPDCGQPTDEPHGQLCPRNTTRAT